MDQPRVHHPCAGGGKLHVYSLKKYCVFTLVHYRQHLADVGWIDVDSLKDVLRHCDANELQAIEDATLEGSERDISWYTWDLWHVLYAKMYGKPPPDMMVPELSGEAPVDYVAPHCDAPCGDWRLVYQMRAEEDANKLANFSARLGASYKAREAEKQGRTVKAVTIDAPPPAKRKRAGTPAFKPGSTPVNSSLFQRPKVARALGLKPSGTGWGKGPIASMVKKPQVVGLGTKGIKIVSAASMAAKKAADPAPLARSAPAPPPSARPSAAALPHAVRKPAGAAAAARPSSSLSASSSRSSQSTASFLRPGVGAPVKPHTAGASKPCPGAPFKPSGSLRQSMPQGPAKRPASSLQGVDLAELVAAAASKKRRPA